MRDLLIMNHVFAMNLFEETAINAIDEPDPGNLNWLH